MDAAELSYNEDVAKEQVLKHLKVWDAKSTCIEVD